MRRRRKKGSVEKYKSYKDYIIEPNLNGKKPYDKYLDIENKHNYNGINETKKSIDNYKGNLKLMLELGSGASTFSVNMAKLYPEHKFIAMEYKEELLLKAIEKVESEGIDNLKFIRFRIESIEDIFSKNSVDTIYLNFSDPWPKARHYKRRLTYRDFLSFYKNILVDNGIIEFKTDHDDMYEFTLEELEVAGFEILEKSYDLHSEKQDVVMTDYEKKYVANGLKIKYVKAMKK